MFKRLRLALLMCAALLVMAPPGAASAAIHRVALVLGNNTGHPDTSPLRYAERDAQRFAAVLRELGQFERVQTVLGGRAQASLAALGHVASEVARLRDRGDQVLFLFYYSGHADETGLQLGATTLTREAMLARLSAVRANMAIVVLDACRVGTLGRRKGIKIVAPRNIPLLRQLEATGRVILAATAAGEDAQESDRLGGSFFTSHLLSGLRGAADRNRDGSVDLSEAYDYAYHRTIASTVTSVAGIQHPTHAIEVRGRRNVILTWPARSASAIAFHARSAGAFLVLSANERVVLAEVPARSGQQMRIGLSPGRYVVRKRAAETVMAKRIVVRRGQTVRLDEATMEREPYDLLAYKRAGVVGWISVTGGLASDLAGVDIHPSFDLGYAIDFGSVVLRPSIGIGFGRDTAGDRDADLAAVAPRVALLRPWRGRWFSAIWGARIGMPIFWQQMDPVEPWVDGTRTVLGVGLDAVVGLSKWIGRHWGIVLEAHVGTRGAKSTTGDPSRDGTFSWWLAAGATAGLQLRF